jgi:nucleoside-diphosphate-sugar epimerase
MAGNECGTAFVTGYNGFLGTELITLLVSRGHRVLALTRSHEGAETLHRIGAVPVIGDLLTPRRWQDEAAAHWVFHQSLTADPGRTFPKRGSRRAYVHLSSDATVLDAVSAGSTRRIVYVADTRCYGAAGSRPVTEDEPPRPTASGRWFVPSLDRLTRYVPASMPIVTVLSNIRLRGIGFRLEHPSVEDGLGQVFRALHE